MCKLCGGTGRLGDQKCPSCGENQKQSLSDVEIAARARIRALPSEEIEKINSVIRNEVARVHLSYIRIEEENARLQTTIKEIKDLVRGFSVTDDSDGFGAENNSSLLMGELKRILDEKPKS